MPLRALALPRLKSAMAVMEASIPASSPVEKAMGSKPLKPRGVTRSAAAVWVQRVSGPSFVELPDGGVSAQLRIKIENQSDVLRTYSFVLIDAADAQLRSPQPTWRIRGRKSMEVPLFVDVPRASFRHGQRGIQLRVADDNGFERVVQATLLGPDGEKP